MVPAGAGVKIPSGGFRIRFDKPGPERVACIGSDRELVVPSSLRGARDPVSYTHLDVYKRQELYLYSFAESLYRAAGTVEQLV